MKSSVILLGAVMSFIKPFALWRCPVVSAHLRRHLPWLQFSSSLWSMQSKTSSQRQRRGMQCARFRQRNSSSRHSFTQPIYQDRKQQASKLFTLSPRRHRDILWYLSGIWVDNWLLRVWKRLIWWMELVATERGRGADLIRAVEAVVMSVTSQAGWHAASAGAHVLVDRTCGENWKGSRSQSAGRFVCFQRFEDLWRSSCVWGHVAEVVIHLLVCRVNHFYSKRSLFFNKWYYKEAEKLHIFCSCMCSEAWLSWFSWHCFGLSPVPWQFLSSSPILQSSWPSQSHFSEMQRLLWHWNWSSAQRSSQPCYNQTQLKHHININDNNFVKKMPTE